MVGHRGLMSVRRRDQGVSGVVLLVWHLALARDRRYTHLCRRPHRRPTGAGRRLSFEPGSRRSACERGHHVPVVTGHRAQAAALGELTPTRDRSRTTSRSKVARPIAASSSRSTSRCRRADSAAAARSYGIYSNTGTTSSRIRSCAEPVGSGEVKSKVWVRAGTRVSNG